ncbi:MAG: ABC transporter ATP-binding protein [Planctomycetota bacterium]|nr:MAG: ABC transporter ATP-binding protein [Planctomycetota bacterium]
MPDTLTSDTAASRDAATSVAALEVEQVRHRYGERTALDEVSLRVAPGEIVALLGPNGSGKTTLFRIVSTLLRPSGGTVRVFGHDVLWDPDAVRRRIGVVFQQPALDPQLTVRENLVFQARLYGIGDSERNARIEQLLARLGLLDRAGDRVGVLSGGLARRADVARGLLHGPGLLLLDEPSAALDPRARRDLMDLLAAERERDGTTIVMTTHLMEQAERADRVVMLDHGRVVAEGTPETLRAALQRDVIKIRTDDPQALAAKLRERFGLESRTIDGLLAIEHPHAETFVPELFEALRGEIREISIARPSLEDVFMWKTGHRLGDGEGES